MLNAAMVRQLNDGPTAATRHWPRDHARMADAAGAHRLAEDPRETAEEGRLTTTGEVTVLPRVRPCASRSLKSGLETPTIALEVNGVDMDHVHCAMPWRVDDERAARAATHRTCCIHASIVIAHIASIDALNASTMS